ncbi:MAG: hypothetical protein MJE68_17265 [Proteobacteria bacterium]|nr:hypothetical protein [Pseudomonadota bacterium]
MTATRKTSRLARTLHVERSKQLHYHMRRGKPFSSVHGGISRCSISLLIERRSEEDAALLWCLLESKTEDQLGWCALYRHGI